MREPHKQVVMDSAALLQFSDPEVAAGDVLALAMAFESLSGFGLVVWSPVVDANVGQGDEVADVRAVAVLRSGVECSCRPDRSA